MSKIINLKYREKSFKIDRLIFISVIMLFIFSVDVTALIIGGREGGYLNGTIDEVAIYNRTLSASEILSHYQRKAAVLADEVNWTINNIAEGSYVWNCLAYDNASFSDWADSNFSLTVQFGPSAPTLNSPADNTFIYVNYALLNFTAEHPSGKNMTCYIYGDNSSSGDPTSLINITTGITAGSSSTYNWTGLNETTYYWKVQCDDGAFNSSYSTIWQFARDLTNPIINNLSCSIDNTLTWINCTDLAYDNNITHIRVNCTDNGLVTQVTYKLKNIPDNNLTINATNATTVDGDFWIYNASYLIRDSGGWNLTVRCIDAVSLDANYSENWTIPYGIVEPYLIYPSDEDRDVAQNVFFNFTAGFTCVGGECINITATLDPKQIEELIKKENKTNLITNNKNIFIKILNKIKLKFNDFFKKEEIKKKSEGVKQSIFPIISIIFLISILLIIVLTKNPKFILWIFSLFLFILLTTIVSAWTNTGGGDHGGADWTISSATTIAGNHYNIDIFKVNSGITATVNAYDGSSYGWVIINATNITIAGTLTASGKGYGGGGGGGGGGGASGGNFCTSSGSGGSGGSGTAGGANGNTGSPGTGCRGCGGASGTGGAGGGSYGGAGGSNAPQECNDGSTGGSGGAGGNGGYATTGGQGDSSTDESLLIGSGGAGGGGAGGRAGMEWDGGWGGGGGGAGNRGGGYIKLYATSSITVSGNIYAKGLDNSAGNGGNTAHGGGYGNPYGTPGGAGGSAAAGGSSNGGASADWDYGGEGGYGAGGGILLKSPTVDGISVTGTIDNRGGGSSTTNGGTVKIFYIGTEPSIGSNYGRKYSNGTFAFRILSLNTTLNTVLKSDESINVKNTAQQGVKEILLKDTAGNKIANFTVSFTQNWNWNDVTAETNSTLAKAFVNIPSGHSEVSTEKTLYIPVKTNAGSVYICPNATSLSHVNTSCPGKYYQSATNISGYYLINVTGSGGGEYEGPNVILNLPLNNSYETTNIIFNCSASTNGSFSLINITLYGNWSNWHANETKNITGISNSTTFTKIINEGSYKWNCLAYDNSNLSAFASSNYTFTVDATAPIINQIQCSNDTASTWMNCTSIIYDDNITHIRVNCTDTSPISAVSYNLTNIPDSNTVINATNYTYKDGDWYNYNSSYLIRDSGEWNLTIICENAASLQNSSSVNWTVPWGGLNVSLVTPTEATNVTQNLFFPFQSRVICVGGECGSVNATLDPLVCNVTSDCVYTDVFHLSNLTNAHAELANESNYNYSVCCYDNESVVDLSTSCSVSYATLVRLSNETNAHAELANESNYDYAVCLQTELNNISCSFKTSCSSDQTCVASISGNTNAHVADCVSDPYSLKVCCSFQGKGVIPTEEGAKPFYTNVSNPQNCSYLRKDDSCLKTWYVNATGAIGASYQFFVDYNMTSNAQYVNNNQTSKVSITILGSLEPVVTLNLPLNNSYVNTANVTFNCSATDDNALANITLYGNWSGWHANETKNLTGTENSITFSKTLNQGSYVWNCLANDFFSHDNSSLSDWGDSNYTFTVDSIYPKIFNESKTPATVNGSSDVIFFVNVTDTNIDTVLLEGNWTETLTNYTVTNYVGTDNRRRYNYTLGSGNLTKGAFIVWRFYVNDSANNINLTIQHNFTIQNQPPVINLINVTTTTTPEKVYLGNTIRCMANITDADGDSLIVTFNITTPNNNLYESNATELEGLFYSNYVELNESGIWYCNVTATDAIDITTDKINFTPIEKSGAISTIVGEIPFYTISPNPMNVTNQSCLGNLKATETCNQTWTVNATGPLGTKWEFYVEYNYSSKQNLTEKVNITIAGDATPIITTPIITPTMPYTNDSLNCSFTISDPDDTIVYANITWYLNDTKNRTETATCTQGIKCNSSLIPTEWTTKTDVWNCSVYAFDDNSSSSSKSAKVTILNYPPIPKNITINSSNNLNRTNGTLTGSYTFTDIDLDTEQLNETKWFNNSIEVIELVNLTSILAGNTTKNQNWTFSIRVYDGSAWSSWFNSTNLTILNSGPVFNKTIANIIWNEDTTLTNNISLYNHFYDIDNDDLTYSVTGNSSIRVIINSTTENVTLIPTADWYGSEIIYFTASDGEYTANSNNITLTVNNVADCGDGACEVGEETSCAADCDWCGDGECNAGETCSSCPGDCGSCPTPSPGEGEVAPPPAPPPPPPPPVEPPPPSPVVYPPFEPPPLVGPARISRGILPCVNVTYIEEIRNLTLARSTVSDLIIPKGYEIIIEPFTLDCRGESLDITLNVPENYINVTLLKCLGNICSPKLIEEITETWCGWRIRDITRKTRFLEPELMPINITEIALNITQFENAIKSGDNSIQFIGKIFENLTAKIAKPTEKIEEAINPNLRIVGTPLILTMPKLKQEIIVTMPYALEENIEEDSIAMYARLNNSWDYIGGSIDKQNKLVTANITNVKKYLDNESKATFALMGILSYYTNSSLQLVFAPKPYSRDAIILVHGFTSSPKTYQNIINDISATNQPFQIWTFGYPSSKTIDEISTRFSALLEEESDKFDNIYIVAHSLGGLITQQALYKNKDYSYVNKIRKLILIGVPNEGAPILEVYEDLFKKLVNEKTEFALFDLNSKMIDDLASGIITPRVPGIKYYVIAGTKAYPLFSKRMQELGYNISDGIVPVKSAQHVGDSYINDKCDNYWELNMTHTDLIKDPIARKVIEKIITEDILKEELVLLGSTNYFNFKIIDCSPQDKYVVIGKKIRGEAVYDATGCKCGNGICGEGEDEFNCPSDCVIYLEEKIPILLPVLIVILILLILLLIYHEYAKYRRVRLRKPLKIVPVRPLKRILIPPKVILKVEKPVPPFVIPRIEELAREIELLKKKRKESEFIRELLARARIKPEEKVKLGRELRAIERELEKLRIKARPTYKEILDKELQDIERRIRRIGKEEYKFKAKRKVLVPVKEVKSKEALRLRKRLMGVSRELERISFKPREIRKPLDIELEKIKEEIEETKQGKFKEIIIRKKPKKIAIKEEIKTTKELEQINRELAKLRHKPKEKIEDLDSELEYIDRKLKAPEKGIRQVLKPIIRKRVVKPVRKTKEILKLEKELKEIGNEVEKLKKPKERISDLSSELKHIKEEIIGTEKYRQVIKPIIKKKLVKPEKKTKEILRLNHRLNRIDEEISVLKIKPREKSTKLEKELDRINGEINNIEVIKIKKRELSKPVVEKQYRTKEILKLNHEIIVLDREISRLKSKVRNR